MLHDHEFQGGCGSTSALVDSSSNLTPPGSIALTPIERGWPDRRFSILREVLGPDFHGPSSSHTAAPQLVALHAHRAVGGTPHFARVKLLNSFATTGDGHRTPIAVTAGLLGLSTTDARTPEAEAMARANGLAVVFEKEEFVGEHPNTLVIEVQRDDILVHLKAISIGGGNYEILEETRVLAQPRQGGRS